MSRILILFASHFGQTRKIAEELASRLRERGHDVQLADARGNVVPPAPDGYDAIVIGSRVEGDRHAREIRRYITAHATALRAIPSAFFSVSMAAARADAGADPKAYMAALFDEQGWRPAQAAAFGGGLAYRRYNWLLRFVMKRISRSADFTTDTTRDHEFTDWNRVRAFADAIAAIAAAPGESARRRNAP